MPTLHGSVVDWYAEHARQLPWRSTGTSPWAVLVSEFMLQQTPVSRVLPVFEAWIRDWPRPVDLSRSSVGDAVRAWDRLGYPRRAVRLHQAATIIVTEHDGEVPTSLAAIRALPGVGDYTAAAVACFAFGQRHAVLDTNVRRVLARSVSGVEYPARAVSRRERDIAQAFLPADEQAAAIWSVAVMELGALVCTARTPQCSSCPIQARCTWRAAGYPAYDGPVRSSQGYAGTDRQCRGRLLALLRDSREPVHHSLLDAVWEFDDQRKRCLESLVDDGLAVALGENTYALP